MSETGITPAYLDEIFDAFNERDLERIAGYFAEDGVFQAPLGPPPYGNRAVGKQQIKDFLSQRWARIPTMRWKDQTTSIVGNTATTAWKVLWTDENGKENEWAGCDLYVFEGRRIKLKDTYWKRPAT
jgi:nuclear transport factor 2 (NTF2) superfamily protein